MIHDDNKLICLQQQSLFRPTFQATLKMFPIVIGNLFPLSEYDRSSAMPCAGKVIGFMSSVYAVNLWKQVVCSWVYRSFYTFRTISFTALTFPEVNESNLRDP